MMMLFPVAAVIDLTFGERAAYAGRMLLIGMATVFLSLSVLWLSLVLFRVVTEKASAKKTAKTAVVPTPATTTVATSTASGDEGAVVAAITAAVAAVLAAENDGVTPAFRVVSYRRVGR